MASPALMDISHFDAKQRLALLDLLVLATYLDQRLAGDEDARVKRLLVAMGLDNPYDRQKMLQDATNRVRRHTENSETALRHAIKLGRAFTTQEQCRQVCSLLEELVSCDGHVAELEKRFLDSLRDSFQV